MSQKTKKKELTASRPLAGQKKGSLLAMWELN